MRIYIEVPDRMDTNEDNPLMETSLDIKTDMMESSGRAFASSLVMEMFNNVTDFYEEEERREKEDLNQKRPPYELMENYLSEHPVEVLDIMQVPTPEGGQVPLVHLTSHKQFVPNICGYHALYNTVQTIHALAQINSTEPHPNRYLDKVAFWHFKASTSRHLHQVALSKGNQGWPWTTENTDSGDLERTFFRHLLVKHPKFMDLTGKVGDYYVQILDFYYQYNRFYTIGGANDLDTLDQAFEAWKSPSFPNMILAFMMGITNHWTCLVAVKRGGKKEYVYLDSRNTPYLQWNESQITEHIDEKRAQRIKDGLKPWDDWQYSVHKQSGQDQGNAVRTVMRCLTGEITIYGLKFEQDIQAFRNSYEETVVAPLRETVLRDFDSSAVSGNKSERLASEMIELHARVAGKAAYKKMYLEALSTLCAGSYSPYLINKDILRQMKALKGYDISDNLYQDISAWCMCMLNVMAEVNSSTRWISGFQDCIMKIQSQLVTLKEGGTSASVRAKIKPKKGQSYIDMAKQAFSFRWSKQ